MHIAQSDWLSVNGNMNDIGDVENGEDEFECSECCFKCSCEMDMIEHSARHKYLNKDSNGVLNITTESSCIGNESEEHDTAVSFPKVFIKEEFETCTNTPEINNLGNLKPNVKREPSSYEEISRDEKYRESEFRNEDIKLEHISVEHEIIPNFPPYQINEYNNIPAVQNYIEHETFSYSSHQINEYDNIHPPPKFKSLGLDPSKSKIKSLNPLPIQIIHHDNYAVMITAAIKTLKEPRGTSRQAILKYILANYKFHEAAAKVQVRVKLAIRKMLATEKLVLVKGISGSLKLAK